jgi:uncharacterized OB-fold protein
MPRVKKNVALEPGRAQDRCQERITEHECEYCGRIFVGPEWMPYCEECCKRIRAKKDTERIEKVHRRMWVGGTDYGDINDERGDYDD